MNKPANFALQIKNIKPRPRRYGFGTIFAIVLGIGFAYCLALGFAYFVGIGLSDLPKRLGPDRDMMIYQAELERQVETAIADKCLWEQTEYKFSGGAFAIEKWLNPSTGEEAYITIHTDGTRSLRRIHRRDE